MNNWLSRKFQNQFKTQDLTKTALSKLQQLEDQKNVSKVQGNTPQETFSKCLNCSTMSGLNNTITVQLSTDLLNKTELNNVTTVEELCREPGFQEFLSAQLNLYYKFIVNSSNNTMLSTAKSRSSCMDNGQSSSISAPDPGTRMWRTSQCQNGSGTTTSQGESSKLLESIPEPALSLIEEEESNGEQNAAVGYGQAQNHLKERSVCNNISKGNQSVSSQPSRLTQRLKDKLLQKPVDVPKPSLPVNSKQINTVKKRYDKSPTNFHASEETVKTGVVDKATRTRTSSTCSTAETSEQLSRVGRKRSSRTAAIESAELIAPPSDDDVFKKPLPPKRKANPSRSSNKRNTTTEDRAKEDDSTLAELQLTHNAGLKVPNRQQPSVSRRIVSEPEATYRSRTGRVSKPPGSFWNPQSDYVNLPSQTKKIGHQREPQIKEKVKLSLTGMDKQSLRSSVTDVDSESGYSSVISGRKVAPVSRVSRVELPAEQSVTSEQALKKLRGRSVKPVPGRGTFSSVDAVKDSEIESQVSSDDAKKPRRGALRKTVSEDMLFEKKEQVASRAPSGKTAAARASRPAAAAKANASKPVKHAPVPVAVTRNIFSDSNSSDDESGGASDTNDHLRQGTVALPVAGQSRPLRHDKLSIVEDSFDEEPAKNRQHIRNRDNSRIAAASKLTCRQTREERVIVESSSDEVDAAVVRDVVARKRQPAVRNPRQTALKKKGQSDVPEESPMVNQKAVSRAKGRFLFAGSSTEEESVCSYRTTDRNAKRAGSESFEDDASYMSGTRSSREKEIPFAEKRSRRPAVVSRFRIRK